jgi:hypothetical protein
VVERLGDPGAELAFLGNVLLEDGKNYHAWSYRQWLLSTFGHSHGLWAGELDRVHHLLSIDHYNNSAWNQRYARGGEKGPATSFFFLTDTSLKTPPPLLPWWLSSSSLASSAR